MSLIWKLSNSGWQTKVLATMAAMISCFPQNYRLCSFSFAKIPENIQI